MAAFAKTLMARTSAKACCTNCLRSSIDALELVSWRERVLFIGTQFSNLYTAVDTPARGRVGLCVVFVCKYVLGHSRVSQPLNLRLCLLRHLGFLTSPHASPTCRRRRLNSYMLLRRSTPGPPPNLRAHLLHLPASPRPPLYTPTITT